MHDTVFTIVSKCVLRFIDLYVYRMKLRCIKEYIHPCNQLMKLKQSLLRWYRTPVNINVDKGAV